HKRPGDRAPVRDALPHGDLRAEAPAGPRLLGHAHPARRSAHRDRRPEGRPGARPARSDHVPARTRRAAGSIDPPGHRGRGRGPRCLRGRYRGDLAKGDRFVILAAVIARARANSGALWLLAATTIANVLGFGYQLVMARLLTAEQYAILIALFGVLILEAISSQVIQSATARLAAQYRARGEAAARHQFVRRWSVRVAIAMASLALVVIALAGPISGGLALPPVSVTLLGISLFFAGTVTFELGLLQGLARFGWMGSVLIVQAGSRLVLGVALVLLGLGVNGAFAGAAAAIAVSLLVAAVPLTPLLRAARRATTIVELGAAETRFFALAAVVLL